MYVVHGTFGEACAWLDGLYTGLDECGSDEVKEWNDFTNWLQRRFRYPDNRSWLGVLMEKFPDDSTAFEQLSLLYTEFFGEREESFASDD